MKKSIILLAIACTTFAACKKDATPPTLSSLGFVNAIAISLPLVPKFNGSRLINSSNSLTNNLSYGVSTQFSLNSGNINATFLQAADTSKTAFSTNINLQEGGIYSLYLTGTTTQPDTVFIKEQLPVYALTDSIAGIRFINLSPTNTVSVDIKGQANGSEVASLAFKGRTGFKAYKADKTISSYIFEFRDAASGNFLVSYTLSGVNNAAGTNTSNNTSRRRNQTIALIGGGTVAQSVILITN